DAVELDGAASSHYADGAIQIGCVDCAAVRLERGLAEAAGSGHIDFRISPSIAGVRDGEDGGVALLVGADYKAREPAAGFRFAVGFDSFGDGVVHLVLRSAPHGDRTARRDAQPAARNCRSGARDGLDKECAVAGELRILPRVCAQRKTNTSKNACTTTPTH